MYQNDFKLFLKKSARQVADLQAAEAARAAWATDAAHRTAQNLNRVRGAFGRRKRDVDGCGRSAKPSVLSPLLLTTRLA